MKFSIENHTSQQKSEWFQTGNLKGQSSDANAEVTENLVTRQRLQSSHNKITRKEQLHAIQTHEIMERFTKEMTIKKEESNVNKNNWNKNSVNGL